MVDRETRDEEAWLDRLQGSTEKRGNRIVSPGDRRASDVLGEASFSFPRHGGGQSWTTSLKALILSPHRTRMVKWVTPATKIHIYRRDGSSCCPLLVRSCTYGYQCRSAISRRYSREFLVSREDHFFLRV